MGAFIENSSFPRTFPSCKIAAVDSNLQQTLKIFKELVIEFEELHSENQSYRNMNLMHKENSKSQTCEKCEELKQNISFKEEILDSVVSALNKLSRTGDLNIIDTIYKLINQDKNIKINLPKDELNDSLATSAIKEVLNDNPYEESVSEIEATPGRRSPIIQSKKIKANTTYSLSLKDKKKCPETWPTPEKKCLKLSYPTPTRNKSSGRLKQGRLNLVKIKTSSVVDLTCSPELERCYSEVNMQCNLKKEILENDDTILPSPTSGSVVQLPILKSILKECPNKLIKPVPISNFKMEIGSNNANTENMLLAGRDEMVHKEVEESINILKQYPISFKSPLKKEKVTNKPHCPDESISLLQHVKKIDEKIKKFNSPIKRPLVENMNLVNTEKLADTQSSMSILQQDTGHVEAKAEINKRMKNIEPVYKEPVLRKKAEKRALPGWSCDECRNFYDELYKDDFEMLAKKMEECSKHRGRNNPIRPKTPDGFWNPRWEVPQDTEEFNLRNNAL